MNSGRQFMDKFLVTIEVDDMKKTGSSNVDRLTCKRKPTFERESPYFSAGNSYCANSSGTDESTEMDTSEIHEPSEDFHMVDTFRYFYPNRRDAFTCWNTKVNARETNYGTRLDYILCDVLLLPFVLSSEVLGDVLGSDHCPVSLTTCLTPRPAAAPPLHSTKHYTEFLGQQQTLNSYFRKLDATDQCNPSREVAQAAESCDAPATQVKQLSNDTLNILEPSESYGNACINKNDTIYIKKRKDYDAFGKHKKKPKQPKLLSYFESTVVPNCKVDKDVTHSKQPLISKTGNQSNVSLYEEELLFMRNNPDLYKKLGLASNDKVNMAAFERYSNEQRDILSLSEHSDSSEKDISQSTNKPVNEQTILKFDNTVQSLDIVSQPSYNNSILTEVQNDRTVGANRGAPAKFTENNSNKLGCDIKSIDLDQAPAEDAEKFPPIQSLNPASNCDNALRPGWGFMQRKVEVPLCPGHNEPCVIRTTKKKGPNFNRRFFACCRGIGRPGQKDAQCTFFKWV